MFHLRYDHQTEKETRYLRYRPEGYLSACGGVNPTLHQWITIAMRSRLGGRDGIANCSKSSIFRGVVFALMRKSLAFTGSNQAYRTISTGQLNALLRLHLRPIDEVVYLGP